MILWNISRHSELKSRIFSVRGHAVFTQIAILPTWQILSVLFIDTDGRETRLHKNDKFMAIYPRI